jgi:hypothetical protein
MGNSCLREKGVYHRVEECSVEQWRELLSWQEKTVKASDFKLAAIKRNTYNDHRG